jgi:MFS family permease
MAGFVIHGIAMGTFLPRLAEIQANLGITESQLGIALVGTSAGAVIGFPFASRAVERLGTKLSMMFGLPLFALAVSSLAVANTTLALFLAFAFQGLMFALANTAMNVEADRVEGVSGKRIMNRCHGMWSIGFLAASLTATGLTALGVSAQAHIAALFPFSVVLVLLLLGPMSAAPSRAFAGSDLPKRRFALPSVMIALISVFAISGLWLEMGSRQWSVIYIAAVFQAPDWIATLSVSALTATQIIGRMSSDSLIARFGPVPVAAVSAATAFAGLLVVVAAPSLWLSMAGFALIGLGVASSIPQAMSAAARLGDRPSSANVASLSLLQTAAMFIAPPLMGLVATQWGMQAAFAIILPLPLLAIVVSRYLAPRPEPASSASHDKSEG